MTESRRRAAARLPSEGLSSGKRRIVDALKRQALTGPELAARFDLTPEAIRQHLNDLSDHGLVRSEPRATTGRGRPPVEWSLTELALDLFPDRHADLTVSLIESIRAAVGDDGLDAVIEQRTADQLAEYRELLGGENGQPSGSDTKADSSDRLVALAELRSAEGYMAEVVDAPDGGARLLIEHHCPICDAAAACQGLCRGELELFQGALGSSVVVSREQHLLAGDERCVYRITPSSGSDSG